MLDLMTASTPSTVLVGREADLGVLREALKRVRGDEPAAVLVGGEAGVGKTRLVEEFCRSLDGEPVRVLQGQCLELGEEGLPFAPFAAALRELARHEGRAVFDGREAEFARLLPELGPPPDFQEARRGHLFELVGALFARLAEEQPVILEIEDLHWADRSTRDLIGFLLRSVRVRRLLLIATYRTDELHRGHPLRPFLAELDRVRGVQRLEVDRLDRDGTAELLGHLLGLEPDPATVDAVAERAQGIPFFIEQFASSADPGCGDIPETLRDLLLSRVDQLPEAAQRVLRVAAVGGTQFGHELLARVAGVDEATLESALRATVAAQLIVFDPTGGYEFRHALVREAVHDDLLPGEHARLHARYAQTIESEPHLVAPDRAPAEIAHHWHAAHDHPRALVAARRAAESASCRYAFAEQARLLERVLELWEQVPEAATLLGTTHLDLLEETALVAIDAGDHLRALSLTRAAIGDLDCEAEPLRAARLLIRRAKLLRNAGKSDGAAEAREAYRLLQSAPRDAAWLRLVGDVAYQTAGIDGEAAARMAGELRSAAADLGDEASQVHAEITFGQVCGGRLPADQAVPTMRQAVERARAAGDVSNCSHGVVNLSDSLFELGDYAESAAVAAEGIPDADRVGVSRTTGVYLLVNYAEALMALGRWDEADARLAEAARQDPPGVLAVAWLRLRARIRLARGHDGAAALVTRAVGFLAKPFLTAEHRVTLLELRLLAALASGDTAAALQFARASVHDKGVFERPRYGWALLVAASRAADEPLRAEIRELAAALPARYPAERAAAAEVAALIGTAPDDGGPVDACFSGGPSAGAGASGGGSGAGGSAGGGAGLGGVEAWRAAVAARRVDGQPYQLAGALLGYAEAVAGDRQAASEALQEAAEIAERLGAGPMLAAVDVLGRRLGVRAGVAHVPEQRGDGEVLTAREREVLRLVAEGQSNSGIARELFISPKTASVHVSRIIAKLEVSNRLEAAAVARRLGMLES
ncbi:putative LuxR-family transcriptional regulator [Actinoplanes missouriensis 431]|uniref:Putative LuxR-family transcriptional regulator n=2 Tax=Actinoplanes missouriensis TaxID=1866 RepID=I0H0R3_ACTM4|nr:putative LuxR-family transcriptional regulator [Actinoplanes missouriensis 431]